VLRPRARHQCLLLLGWEDDGEKEARVNSNQTGEGKRCAGTSRGSVLLYVLLLCLALAVMVQALCAVVVVAQRARTAEAVGRAQLAERDRGLAVLCQQALSCWSPSPWQVVYGGENACGGENGEPIGAVEGALSELAGAVTPVKEASVRQDPSVCALGASAWVEEGRDGLDLPMAALVAGSVRASSSRQTPWLDCEAETEALTFAGGGAAPALVPAYVVHLPENPILGPGCVLEPLDVPWRLDPGWGLLAGLTESGSASTVSGVVPGPGVLVVRGHKGELVHLSELMRAPASGESDDESRFVGTLTAGDESPAVLTVVVGGADLDASNLGEVQGVLVVDDGSIYLDGTVLQGAAFATREVEVGESGTIVYRESVLRWATDRSLRRTRLVPGSRKEGGTS